MDSLAPQAMNSKSHASSVVTSKSLEMDPSAVIEDDEEVRTHFYYHSLISNINNYHVAGFLNMTRYISC